jgi:heptaprenyl diphosphate synthase
MRSAGPSAPADERLRELLARGPLTDDAAHAEALGLLRSHPGMDAARADLNRWAEVAREQILELPPVWARAAFEKLCDFVIKRSG